MNKREIDRLVAKHITKHIPLFNNHFDHEGKGTPHYSTKIDDAMKIFDIFNERNKIEITRYPGFTIWHCDISVYKKSLKKIDHYRSFSRLLPLAICKAALLTKGIDIDA